MRRTALITGISGQDGSYLSELLLEKGYRVFGTTRDAASARHALPAALCERVELVEWDLLDEKQIADVLAMAKPDEVYNFAAYSSGAGMYEEAVRIGEVNGIAVTRLLEALRAVDTPIRFCQASSSEVFGGATQSPQSETTPFSPRSPYGAAKLYAQSMVAIYRQRYGLFSCSAILFNHESPRRRPEFVTRKIVREAVRIRSGLSHSLALGDLEARRDWGFAGDYVRAMWLMLQAAHADDYVVASGETHSVGELCECAFAYLGLDYREYVDSSDAHRRPREPVELVGDPTRIKERLAWSPEVRFRDLVHLMVDAELKMLQP